MKEYLGLICLFAAFFSSAHFVELFEEDTLLSFDEFKIKFSKIYSDVENYERRVIYEKNVAYIKTYNDWAREQRHDSRLGVNAFCDRHPNEMTVSNSYLALTRGWHNIPVIDEMPNYSTPREKRAATPTNWDWRDVSNRVNSIMDQGDCKADWAFAIASAIETAYAINQNKAVEVYSAQQLLDCTDKTGGCLGGSIHNAAIYALNNGILLNSSYPYLGYQSSTCSTGSNGVKPVRIYRLTGALSKLKDKIYNTGPVVINMLASGDFFYYKTGLFVDANCHNPQGLFSLTIIGFGTTTDSKQYWILRNSLGTSWGIDGYMRLPIRTDNKYCGVAIEPIWMNY